MAAPASLPFLQVDAFTQDPFGGNPAGDRLPRRPAQRRLAAGSGRRDEPVGDGLPAPPRRWPLRSAVVHAGGRSDAVRPRHAGQRARAVDDRPGRRRRADRVRDAERRADGKARHGARSGSGLGSGRTGADGAITIDLPLRPVTPATLPVDVLAALGIQPIAVHAAGKGPGGIDYIVECADEATVTAARPDMGPLKAVDGGVILTARASTRGWDFVSRYFVPAFGIDEDPVTGSAHCALAPYWAGTPRASDADGAPGLEARRHAGGHGRRRPRPPDRPRRHRALRRIARLTRTNRTPEPEAEGSACCERRRWTGAQPDHHCRWKRKDDCSWTPRLDGP